MAPSVVGFVPSATLPRPRRATSAEPPRNRICMGVSAVRRRQFDLAVASPTLPSQTVAPKVAPSTATLPASEAPAVGASSASPYAEFEGLAPQLGGTESPVALKWLRDNQRKALAQTSAVEVSPGVWQMPEISQDRGRDITNPTVLEWARTASVEAGSPSADVEMAPGGWKTEFVAPVGGSISVPVGRIVTTPVNAPVEPTPMQPKVYDKKSIGDQLRDTLKSIGTDTSQKKSAKAPATSNKASAAVADPKASTKSSKPSAAVATTSTNSSSAVKAPAKKAKSGKKADPKSSTPPPSPKAKGFGKKKEVPPQSMAFSLSSDATSTFTSGAMYSTNSSERGVAWDAPGHGWEDSEIGSTRSPIEALFRAVFRAD